MYAIVETCGKQYRVQEGDTITVESLGVDEGETVLLDKALLVGSDNGVTVGTPYVSGASVSASIVTNGKGSKILVFKFKSKKNVRKKQGHRQNYTDIKIREISVS